MFTPSSLSRNVMDAARASGMVIASLLEQSAQGFAALGVAAATHRAS